MLSSCVSHFEKSVNPAVYIIIIFIVRQNVFFRLNLALTLIVFKAD